MVNTDESGEIWLSLPEGIYDVVLHARGYLTVALRGIAILAGGTSLMIRALVAGDGMPSVAPAAGAIAGRVLDENGEGEPNAMLQATSAVSTHITQTDPLGNYFFHALPPQEYTLTLRTHKGLTAKQRTVESRYFTLVRADFSILPPRVTLESLLPL